MEGGAETGLPAGGGEAKEEKASPRPPNTHTCTVTHTHTQIHTSKKTLRHILSPLHSIPTNTHIH